MDKEKKYDTLHGVIIDKRQLLSIIKDNLEKHDAIYEVACSGFWQAAQEKLNNKKAKFEQTLNDLNKEFSFHFDIVQTNLDKKDRNLSLPSRIGESFLSFDYNLGLNYSENHSDDYKRTIRMLELSVADKIQLTQSEFDAYVLNNWTWKNSFNSTNLTYVTGFAGVSGSTGPKGYAGYHNKYTNAVLAGSGIGVV
jgi:hypothetical protein